MSNFKLIGDWGLGIGDCPIPNPQSPIIFKQLTTFNKNNKNNNIITMLI